MHAERPTLLSAVCGPDFPTSNVASAGEAVPNPLALSRVGEVLQAIAAARTISDGELRQHAMDCTHLMEVAYERYQAHRIAADREEAALWMHRRDEALRSLSPAWKAAREAEIQRAIAADHFVEQGDAGRARIAGGRG
jgi:hypothetical protein